MSARQLTRLEKLQKETNGIEFIKSYPILLKIKELSPTEIKFIELVVSYQDRGQKFQMKYKTVAEIFNLKLTKAGKPQSVTDMVSKLKRLGIFETTNKSNYNGSDAGGSSTGINVNFDVLIGLIPTTAEPAPAPTPDPKEDKAQETTEIDEPIVTLEQDPTTIEPEPVQEPEQVEQPASEDIQALLQYLTENYESKDSYHLKMMKTSIQDRKTKTIDELETKIKLLNFVKIT